MRPLFEVLARALEPLAALRVVFFFVWSALAAFIWICGVGEVELAGYTSNAELRTALQFGLLYTDLLLLGLGTLLLHHCLSLTEGLRDARAWAAGCFVISMGLAWLCRVIHTPPLTFTTRLGPHLFHVPLGWCLLWYCIAIGARAAAISLFPRFSHARTAVITGVLIALSMWNLELAARPLRSWWIWNAGAPDSPAHAPFLFFSTAGFAGLALALWMRPGQVVRRASSQNRLAAGVFTVLNTLFFILWLRGVLA
jgi:hypothetical protein